MLRVRCAPAPRHTPSPRSVGWYRKHFSVPSDWKGSTVWVYIEGVFHESTFYLNGKQLAFHPAG